VRKGKYEEENWLWSCPISGGSEMSRLNEMLRKTRFFRPTIWGESSTNSLWEKSRFRSVSMDHNSFDSNSPSPRPATIENKERKGKQMNEWMKGKLGERKKGKFVTVEVMNFSFVIYWGIHFFDEPVDWFLLIVEHWASSKVKPIVEGSPLSRNLLNSLS
jgi:hypothetical protein